MSKKKHGKKPKSESGDLPGARLEKVVARIQQLMDPNSQVTHNERLEDRVGNTRQYDVVIRGRFGGRPILGVIECKDHSRKKGPDAVEQFAKKTENLGANIRMMVSKKGFTKQALALAKHENIACLSLLPHDPKLVGFEVGHYWYGTKRKWIDVRLKVTLADGLLVPGFRSETMKWQGKSVAGWFVRELLTTYGEHKTEGWHSLDLTFAHPEKMEIEGTQCDVSSVGCLAKRIHRNKKRWVSYTGDAFYDWQAGALIKAGAGEIVGSPVETDVMEWDDYDGPIPGIDYGYPADGFTVVLFDRQEWKNKEEVADLIGLAVVRPPALVPCPEYGVSPEPST